MYKVKKNHIALWLSVIMLIASFTACGSEVDATLADETLIVPTETNYKMVQAKKTDFRDEAISGVYPEYPLTKELTFDRPNTTFVKMLVEKDDEVKKGERLASFMVEESSVPLEEKRLELKRVKNAFERGKESRRTEKESAQTELKRLGSGSVDYRIKKLEIQKLEIAYDQYLFTTEHQMKSLEATIAELNESLELQYLKAPFAGKVGAVSTLKEGDKSDPAVPIMTLYSSERLLLKIDSKKGFRYNDQVTIRAKVMVESMEYQGTIVSSPSILPASLAGAPTYVVMTAATQGPDVDKVNKMLQSALSGAAGWSLRDFENSTVAATAVKMPGVLTLDAQAVKTINGKIYVSILENDTLKKRYLSSTNFNKDQYWILDGLSEGQTVVVN